MNNQQNIDDILKLLKSSYNDGDTDTPEKTEYGAERESAISQFELQERLKKQFMSAEDENKTSDGESSDDFSYTIDDGFLSEEFLEEKSEPDEERQESGDTVFEIEKEKATEIAAEEEMPQTIDDTPAEDENVDIDLLFAENDKQEIHSLVDEESDVQDVEIIETELELEADEKEPEMSIETRVEEAVAEETAETVEEEPVIEAVEEEAPVFFSDDNGQLTFFDNNGSLAVAPEEEVQVGVEIIQEDEDQIVMDFGDLMSDEPDEEIPNEDIFAGLDDSAIDLMFGFGDLNRAAMKTERVSSYLNRAENQENEDIDASAAFGFEGEEYENAEQTDDIMMSYRRDRLITFIRTGACGILTLMLFFYELFGMLGIELYGIFSYIDYPTVYALIALQIFVFSAACAWRELLGGLKKAFGFKADRWSLVSIVSFFVVVHGVIISIIAPGGFKHMFGTVGSLYIFFGLFTECIEVCREIKCFSVYSSDKRKFTVSTESPIGSSAEKMYAGGLSKDKKVFEPIDIDFPKGYFSAVNSERPSDKLVNYAIAPMIIVSTLALLISTLLGNNADVAFGTFMTVITLLCPISTFAIHTFPMMWASSKLYNRECAVASEAMVEKYARCDYMVFKDMHLFSEAVAQDNGIVMYDVENARRTLEYLGALYSAIGGPMKNVFSEVLDGVHSVNIRRIARNGVEAVLDNSHSLILGDSSFGMRYGIVFPTEDEKEEGTGTLVFAVDGRPAAKLRIKYKTTPFFEMIAKKLADDSVKCVIETYDPVINSAFVSKCRGNKNNPINVVHKNANDMYSEIEIKPDRSTGLVVCSSRFKLAETVVWCKRILSTLKISAVVQTVMYAVLFALATLAIAFNMSELFNQYIVILCQALCVLPVFGIMAIKFPSEDHFSIGKVRK